MSESNFEMKNEFEVIRTQLIAQRSAILNKTAEFKHSQLIAGEKISDDAEAAQFDVENNLELHLHERDRMALLMIDRALGKLIAGTFGQCESCGIQISTKRLVARPFADLCIDCQEELEAHKNKSLN